VYTVGWFKEGISEPNFRQIYGVEVTAIGWAFKALQTFSTMQFEMILSDLGMPQMDGDALMGQICHRPKDQGGRIPAIALTAYAGKVDYQQAIEPTEIVTIVAHLGGRKGKAA
jgi:CheY-like chemotaxis protein